MIEVGKNINQDLLKILFVENIEAEKNKAEDELRKENIRFESLLVNNETDYIRAISTFSPDIIISDYNLGTFDGKSALKLLRLSKKNIPFIIFTGSQNEEVAVDCLKTGASDYILKEQIKRLPFAVIEAITNRQIKQEKEEAVREILSQRNILEAVFESSPYVLILLDKDNKIVNINNEGVKFTGKSKEEIINKLQGDAFECYNSLTSMGCGTNPDCLGCAFRINSMETLITGKSIYNHETKTIWHKREHNLLISTSLVKREIENLVLISIIDITEKRRTETRIKDIQLLLQSSIESPKDMIFLSIDQDFNILYFNSVYKKITHMAYHLDIQPGMNLLDCITVNNDREHSRRNFSRALSGENLVSIHQFTGIYNQYYETKFSPIYNEDNRIIGATSFSANITERLKIEQTLKERQLLYSSLVETSQDLIWRYDNEGKLTYLNEVWEKTHGYKTEELIGHTFQSIQNEEDYKKDKEVFSQLLNGKSLKDYETKHKSKDGKTIYLSFNAVPLFDIAGNIVGAQGTAIDMTQRKFSELLLIETNEEYRRMNEELSIAKRKAEESDKLKSAFLENISHEIRTPMNSIMGFSQLLNNQMITEDKKRKYINLINTNCQELLTIITDIIDISKITLNKIIVTPRKTNLEQLLKEIKEEQKTYAQSKNIGLSYFNNLYPRIENIIIDESKLKQILTNLVNNAIKFTGYGEIEYGCIQKDLMIEFYVTDTGCGIPEEKFEFIFDRFSKLDNQPETSRTGTGLGLSITKAYVQLLGGNIRLKSELNKGTTFYFDIPLKTTNKQQNQGNMMQNTYNWKNKTILVAEDDYMNYVFIEEVLTETEATLIHAQDGQKALDLFFETKTIDIILMDIKMPIINGLVATKEIRKTNLTIPIIALTANAFSEDRANAIEAGCNDLISKPINVDKFLQKIASYFF